MHQEFRKKRKYFLSRVVRENFTDQKKVVWGNLKGQKYLGTEKRERHRGRRNGINKSTE